jgi:hypothetical protein
VELVNADGTNCWSQIATHLEGRVGKQCRERWRNHLDPNILRDSFSPEEDDKILELVQELGTRWSKIAQRLPGRTENSVKNRYHCFLKNKDTNNGKRARDDKGNGSAKKRMTTDKYMLSIFGDDLGGKSSPEGNFCCNLLGCGKTFTQLSHLLGHRLTHFTEGRFPSSHTSATPMTHTPISSQMHVEQRPAENSGEGAMFRGLDGLVDDLISRQPTRRLSYSDEDGKDSGEKGAHHHSEEHHHHHLAESMLSHDHLHHSHHHYAEASHPQLSHISELAHPHSHSHLMEESIQHVPTAALHSAMDGAAGTHGIKTEDESKSN